MVLYIEARAADAAHAAARRHGLLPAASRDARRSVRRRAQGLGRSARQPAGEIPSRRAALEAIPAVSRRPAARRPRRIVPLRRLERERTRAACAAGVADDRRRVDAARVSDRRLARHSRRALSQQSRRLPADAGGQRGQRVPVVRDRTGADPRVRDPAEVAAGGRLERLRDSLHGAAGHAAHDDQRRDGRPRDAREPDRSDEHELHPHRVCEGPVAAGPSCCATRCGRR